jgi:hypothetical protein
LEILDIGDTYLNVYLFLKTCVVKRFVGNSFQGNQYNPTPGVDFSSRRMTVKPLGTATLIILDIGGLAISSKMLNIYLNSGIDVSLNNTILVEFSIKEQSIALDAYVAVFDSNMDLTRFQKHLNL